MLNGCCSTWVWLKSSHLTDSAICTTQLNNRPRHPSIHILCMRKWRSVPITKMCIERNIINWLYQALSAYSDWTKWSEKNRQIHMSHRITISIVLSVMYISVFVSVFGVCEVVTHHMGINFHLAELAPFFILIVFMRFSLCLMSFSINWSVWISISLRYRFPPPKKTQYTNGKREASTDKIENIYDLNIFMQIQHKSNLTHFCLFSRPFTKFHEFFVHENWCFFLIVSKNLCRIKNHCNYCNNW